MKKFYTLITGVMMMACSFSTAKESEYTPEENKKILQKFFEKNYQDSAMTKEKAKALIKKHLLKSTSTKTMSNMWMEKPCILKICFLTALIN